MRFKIASVWNWQYNAYSFSVSLYVSMPSVICVYACIVIYIAITFVQKLMVFLASMNSLYIEILWFSTIAFLWLVGTYSSLVHVALLVHLVYMRSRTCYCILHVVAWTGAHCSLSLTFLKLELHTALHCVLFHV